MENAQESSHSPKTKDNSIIFYVLGGVIVTAIVVVGFLLYPRQSAEEPMVQGMQQEEPVAVVESKGPISGLVCTSQYYNTVLGFPGTYYLSVEGEAPTAAGNVTCDMTATVNNEVVGTAQIAATTTQQPDRGGFGFKCSTQGMKLTPGVATKVSYEVKDANNNSVTCNKTFLLP